MNLTSPGAEVESLDWVELSATLCRFSLDSLANLRCLAVLYCGSSFLLTLRRFGFTTGACGVSFDGISAEDEDIHREGAKPAKL